MTKLRQENSQLREISEVARHQLTAVEERRRREEEVESDLQHQLKELQVQSEQNTLIAKLQQQLLTMKVSGVGTSPSPPPPLFPPLLLLFR